MDRPGMYLFRRTKQRRKSIVDEFKPVLEDAAISKTGQNIKFDILMLKWYGVEV